VRRIIAVQSVTGISQDTDGQHTQIQLHIPDSYDILLLFVDDPRNPPESTPDEFIRLLQILAMVWVGRAIPVKMASIKPSINLKRPQGAPKEIPSIQAVHRATTSMEGTPDSMMTGQHYTPPMPSQSPMYPDETRSGGPKPMMVSPQPPSYYAPRNDMKTLDNINTMREENARLDMELSDCLDILERKNHGMQEALSLKAQIEGEKNALQRQRIMTKAERQLAILVTSICYQKVHTKAQRYDGGCDEYLQNKERELAKLKKSIHDLEELVVLQRAQAENQQARPKHTGPMPSLSPTVQPRVYSTQPAAPLPTGQQLAQVYQQFLGSTRQHDLLKRI
jgi:hypothetical protein